MPAPVFLRGKFRLFSVAFGFDSPPPRPPVMYFVIKSPGFCHRKPAQSAQRQALCASFAVSYAREYSSLRRVQRQPGV